MLTQDPLRRATTLLKGAKKPVRIFVGVSRDLGATGVLAAVLETTRLRKNLPHVEMTVAADTPPEELAAALATAWARLNVQIVNPKPGTTTPRPGHGWRTYSSYARKSR